jgi:hypothetical protein
MRYAMILVGFGLRQNQNPWSSFALVINSQQLNDWGLDNAQRRSKIPEIPAKNSLRSCSSSGDFQDYDSKVDLSLSTPRYKAALPSTRACRL